MEAHRKISWKQRLETAWEALKPFLIAKRTYAVVGSLVALTGLIKSEQVDLFSDVMTGVAVVISFLF